MKVKVIFPAIDVGDPCFGQREFEWEAPGDTDEVALEQTFREFNTVEDGDPHIARKCRSMSAGDIAICVGVNETGRIYLCAPAGWRRMTPEEAEKWLAMSRRERFDYQLVLMSNPE